MNGRLIIKGNAIYLESAGDCWPYATANDLGTAQKVLERAARLQEKSRYTDSARTYRKAEELPGFRWLNEEEQTNG